MMDDEHVVIEAPVTEAVAEAQTEAARSEAAAEVAVAAIDAEASVERAAIEADAAVAIAAAQAEEESGQWREQGELLSMATEELCQSIRRLPETLAEAIREAIREAMTPAPAPQTSLATGQTTEPEAASGEPGPEAPAKARQRRPRV